MGGVKKKMIFSNIEECCEALGFLLEKQNEALRAMKEAFEDVSDTQLGLPDLVIAYIWSFAKPDLWERTEDKLRGE